LSVSGTSIVLNWGTFWGSANEDKLFSVAVDDNNVTGPLATNTVGVRYFVSGQSNAAAAGSSAAERVTLPLVPTTRIKEWQMLFGRKQAPLHRQTLNFQQPLDRQMMMVGIALRWTINATLLLVVTVKAPVVMSRQAWVPFAQPTSGGGTDGFLLKFGNLIVPNAPTFSTSGEGGTFSAATSVCSGLNTSATGFTGLASGTPSGSCPSSAVQTMVVRLDNAVQGVTYRLRNATTGGGAVDITAGTGTTQATNNLLLHKMMEPSMFHYLQLHCKMWDSSPHLLLERQTIYFGTLLLLHPWRKTEPKCTVCRNASG
jgi:hypothetical protein